MERHGGRARVLVLRSRRYRGLWGERVGGGMSERVRGGVVLEVDCRKVVRRSCVEVVGVRARRIRIHSGIGKLLRLLLMILICGKS